MKASCRSRGTAPGQLGQAQRLCQRHRGRRAPGLHRRSDRLDGRPGLRGEGSCRARRGRRSRTSSMSWPRPAGAGAHHPHDLVHRRQAEYLANLKEIGAPIAKSWASISRHGDGAGRGPDRGRGQGRNRGDGGHPEKAELFVGTILPAARLPNRAVEGAAATMGSGDDTLNRSNVRLAHRRCRGRFFACGILPVSSAARLCMGLAP
jgi:hypothetical protein